MIYKYVVLNEEQLFLKAENILNKVASSMRNDDNFKLMYHLQPDVAINQDAMLLRDAFKMAIKTITRAMSPYIDTTPRTINLSPKSMLLDPNPPSERQKVLNITSDGNWLLLIDDPTVKANIVVIWLKFPDTWLDVGILQDQVEDCVTTLVIARYLENVDMRLAGSYTRDGHDKIHDLKTMCATRKPGTRFYVTSPFGENPYRRY